jgi:hypothetical protein
MQLRHTTQVTFTLSAFLGQDVATERITVFETIRGLFEALRSAALSFDLWHFDTPKVMERTETKTL